MPLTTGGYRPLDDGPRNPLGATGTGPSGGLFYRVALPFLVLGVFLLIGGGIISQGVAAQNHLCAQTPMCPGPQPDPSGGFYAGGAGLLLIGVVLLIVGATRRTSLDDE
ncbi:MAG TPA: hypothetical protein VML53_01475 [Thermoplasmata archaeon]|nr:hypothetical protein [Thermoplasmata archaeon]